MAHQTKIKPQPLDRVNWVHRDMIEPNDYNPNQQPPPEYRLLKISILEDGWTQPIVVFDMGNNRKPIIIDGEHRWMLSADPEIYKMTDGCVPIVRIAGDEAHRRMSTIRHNRARGEHRVVQMAQIVKGLLENGVEKDEIEFLLQMEDEEVERLAERAGMPEIVHRVNGEFNKGWIPK